MEPTGENQRERRTVENTQTKENASDRESSVESVQANKSEVSATEAELIDVDDIELSDEESWLYKSPKKQMPEEKMPSTEKWLQKNIDDMNDIELKVTRTALLSKLDQLKLLNSNIKHEGNKREIKPTNFKNSAEKKTSNDVMETNSDSISRLNNDTTNSERNVLAVISKENEPSNTHQQLWGNGQVFDVIDVMKIAKLQEESLKQSSCKFLSKADKNTLSSRDLSPASPVQIKSLNKPASVDGLHICTDKGVNSSMYSIIPLHDMKKGIFSSSSPLNCGQEFHRSSLPNINKGYYSLKSKKSKCLGDHKVPCPLPMYPSHSKSSMNRTLSQCSDLHNKSSPSSKDHTECRTLPSSYRVHSRSSSLSNRDGNLISPPYRRDSMPFLGNNSAESNLRDKHRKYSSPTVSSTKFPRYNSSSSATVSPTKAFNSQLQSLRSPPDMEYPRAVSHSPSKRSPLSTVQHASPRKGNGAAFRKNDETKMLKMPSKIPNPTPRSGIPVPSTAYASRTNDGDAWSQDCF